jgi:hypothetical protein
MVKLKRVNEGQLDLFSWKPKEIDPPKQNTASTSNKDPEQYDGLTDTNQPMWFKPYYLKQKYGEYNRRFFNGALPALPIHLGSATKGKTIGSCKSFCNAVADTITPIEIILNNKNYANRYNMENVLIHEMCHAYQMLVLCEGKLSRFLKDSKQGSGSSGHGPLFFKAADMVNNSSDNTEGFKITQYEESGQVISKGYAKADGWLVIIPNLTFISMINIADTPTGRSQIVNYNPICAFTYKDGDVKAKYVDRLGRKKKSFYYTLPWLKDMLNDIENGSLIPVRKDTQSVTLFIGKDMDSSQMYFLSTTKQSTKNDYKDIVDVKMNAPFDKLQNLLGNSKWPMYTRSYADEVEGCIKAGVYTVNKTESKEYDKNKNKRIRVNENIEDSDVIDELEKIKNVVGIEGVDGNEFELVIC